MKPPKEIPPHEALTAYLTKNPRIKKHEFAEEMGVSRGILFRWMNGYGVPSRERAVQLEAETGVKASAWKRLGRGVDSPAISKLQAVADERCISATELARELGIPQRNIVRYFHGGMPAQYVVDLINNHFGWELTRKHFVCKSKKRSLRPAP